VDLILDAFAEAWRLVVTGDAETFHALWVSVLCCTVAITLAALLAVPYGGWLGLHRPRGHAAQAFALRVGMSVPTVAIGILVYAFVSRRGILGSLDLIYTQAAIVIGQFLLAFPLLGSLAHGAVAHLDPVVAETARTHGAGRARAVRLALGEVRPAVVAAYLAAFARCITELGIATTVGGAFKLHTRTLPAMAQLELSKGEFGKALAPGILLVVLACGAAVLSHLLSRESRS
jgi:tungstate transport system permease protein